MKMKALVTGATGFIGSNLVKRLVDLGWEVGVLVRDRNNLGRISGIKGLTIYQGNLLNKKSILKASSGIDVIFNCAAALPYHKLKDTDYIETNVRGLKNILDIVKGSKIKLVHLSTVGIYNVPKDIYASTKLEGEELIRKYQNERNIKAVIIRPTIAYGPGDTRPGFLNLFRLIKKGIFPQIAGGENFFHTIYVDNLIEALVLAARKKDAVNNDFIIGDEDVPKMKEILGEMAEIIGSKPIRLYIPKIIASLFLPNRRVRFLTENKKYKIDKAKRILGYKPKIKLEEGLQKTYDWYRQNGYL